MWHKDNLNFEEFEVSESQSTLSVQEKAQRETKWKWRRHIRPKRWLIFNGLRGVVSTKLELFITTTVRTSNFSYALESVWAQSWIRGFIITKQELNHSTGAFSSTCVLSLTLRKVQCCWNPTGSSDGRIMELSWSLLRERYYGQLASDHK